MGSSAVTSAPSSPSPDWLTCWAEAWAPGEAFTRSWRCTLDACDGAPHEGAECAHARSAQVIPVARVAYLAGGRGSGKTWAGARNLAQLILETRPDQSQDYTEWAVVAPTYKDARDVCMEGPSGLLRPLRDAGLVADWQRSFGRLVLTTGAVVWVDAGGEGGLRIQGKNLNGAWCEEVGLWRSWRRAWEESIAFAVRKPPARIIATGTPKRSSLAGHLLDDPEVWTRRLLTRDNLTNLDAATISYLERRYAGTSLGRQELEGILATDVEDALWTRSLIDAGRVEVHEPPWWERTILALDPSDGNDDSDEQAMVLVSQSPADHHLYVRHSEGVRTQPWGWLTKAVRFAAEHNATMVVEKNHGGAYLMGMLAQVLDAQKLKIPYISVDAGSSKRTRAEQVVGLYEQGRVHHVGHHPDLEDQMCTWTGHLRATPGAPRELSPDRMDALVWALTPWVATPVEASPPRVAEPVDPAWTWERPSGRDWELGWG